MAQDLRELFEKGRKKEGFTMREGHENRFFERLEAEMPLQKKGNAMQWARIAASIAIVLGLGSFLFFNGNWASVDNAVTGDGNALESESKNISLGDLSPDLQKLESYYVANINLELASLEVSEKNKDFVDDYMERLSSLSQEYNLLITELNEIGPNDQTIEALIQNFQLQLTLIQKLKTKLNQYKSSENEQKI